MARNVLYSARIQLEWDTMQTFASLEYTAMFLIKRGLLVSLCIAVAGTFLGESTPTPDIHINTVGDNAVSLTPADTRTQAYRQVSRETFSI